MKPSRGFTLYFTRYFTLHFTRFFTQFFTLFALRREEKREVPREVKREMKREVLRGTAWIGAAAIVAVIPLHAADSQYVMVTVPRTVLQRYVGEYVYPAGNSVMIRLHDDVLYRETGNLSVPLVPVSETRFRIGPVFTAEFLTDTSGAVTQVLSDGVGVEYRLPRRAADGTVPPPLAAPMPPAVSVPKSVLQRYVGVYEFLPGQLGRDDLFITIRLKGDTLTREISGALRLPLIPMSETRFRVGGTAMDVEFAVDAAGGVTQVSGTGEQQLKARLTRKP